VIINDQDLVLVGERSDYPGAWQLPQGGVEPDESPEDAVIRELDEEIGTKDVTIIQRAAAPVDYEFPPELQGGIAKQFRGQRQWWFKLKLTGPSMPDLSRADGEFMSLEWRPVDQIVSDIVHWKKQAYQAGFELLGWQGE
jgi:putative (di)nucleoside polyphosphate hydrolase